MTSTLLGYYKEVVSIVMHLTLKKFIPTFARFPAGTLPRNSTATSPCPAAPELASNERPRLAHPDRPIFVICRYHTRSPSVLAQLKPLAGAVELGLGPTNVFNSSSWSHAAPTHGKSSLHQMR